MAEQDAADATGNAETAAAVAHRMKWVQQKFHLLDNEGKMVLDKPTVWNDDGVLRQYGSLEPDACRKLSFEELRWNVALKQNDPPFRLQQLCSRSGSGETAGAADSSAGVGAGAPPGARAGSAYWAREVRPATSGVAEWYSAPPPRLGSSSSRLLTRAVRFKFVFELRRL